MADGKNLPVPVGDWFSLVHRPGGGALPIPFVKDVFLLKSTVVGTGFVKNIVKKTENIVPGCVLEFRRDPRNRYDELAIQVLNGSGERIGFVPRRDNPVLARLMDAGKMLYGKVRKIPFREDWPQIEIDIYMRDL
ncbi:MAG: HIRAN domain-containing protein [Lentisphaeria bacterium]|nr:HIRAN domain-containing protein [Lentisphaeria bacterium]